MQKNTDTFRWLYFLRRPGGLSRRYRRGEMMRKQLLEWFAWFLSQFCNHTKTGRNHYSFIFILTNPTDRVLRKRAEIVVHRWFVGCISPVGLRSGQISFTCWRIAYWNWKLRCNDFYFWNDFVSAVNNDLLLAYACLSQVLLWGETLDDFYKVERTIYKLIKKKHSFLNAKMNH